MAHKIGTTIDNQSLDGTYLLGTSSDSRKISIITHVDREGNHIQVILFFNPTDSH